MSNRIRFGIAALWSILCFPAFTQNIQTVETLDLDNIPAGTIQRLWVRVSENTLAQPIYVPVMVAKGSSPGPVLGLTAAIHGDELNGIPIIQKVFERVDPARMQGTLVGVPGLNAVSVQLDQRRFVDDEDLNRNFPGKPNGTNSEQYNYAIFQKIIRKFNYLVDLHTASFGRVNALYVRADLSQDTLGALAQLFDADILLDGKGASAGGAASGRTLREEAVLNGIPCITVEYGNPQVYQDDMVRRGQRSILNMMVHLKMVDLPMELPTPAVLCKKSYWIYVQAGGLLEVPVSIAQKIKKGDLIGIQRNPFGDIIQRYYAPEDGIVIGKSTNPSNSNGGRILHLGILK